MNLKEYVEKLNKLIEEGHGDKVVIYSKDDEGNGYNTVNYDPIIGAYDENERDMIGFNPKLNDEESAMDGTVNKVSDCNCVCVN